MASFLLGLLCLLVSESFCYKPVIILHGILDHASDMEDLASFITQAHPGTNITLIKLYEELDSFAPLWTQVSAVTEKIRPVMQAAKDGVHIIGFSQGIGKAWLLISIQRSKSLKTYRIVSVYCESRSRNVRSGISYFGDHVISWFSGFFRNSNLCSLSFVYHNIKGPELGGRENYMYVQT